MASSQDSSLYRVPPQATEGNAAEIYGGSWSGPQLRRDPTTAYGQTCFDEDNVGVIFFVKILLLALILKRMIIVCFWLSQANYLKKQFFDRTKMTTEWILGELLRG